MLVYHHLLEGEDPHSIKLNLVDIWLQIYDLPQGLVSENIFRSIGDYVGMFVKAYPANFNGGWKMYSGIRVTMNLEKPWKKRTKIKRGGDWSWINFKYERLSVLCFICGMLGHRERDCGIAYANPDKEITRAYGVWLRAPTKNNKTANIRAKWLRNGGDGSKFWDEGNSQVKQSATVHGRDKAEARFMEVDGKITEIPGKVMGIKVVPRNQGVS